MYKIFWLTIILISIFFLCPGMATAKGDDPFGDPFADQGTGDIEDFVGASMDSSAIEAGFEVAGELQYGMLALFDFTDDTFESPVYLNHSLTGDIDFSYKFGRTMFAAGIRAQVEETAPGEQSTALTVRRFSASHTTDFSDIEIGFYELAWSMMNAYKLIDFFQPARALPFFAASGNSSRLGIRTIFYHDIFSFDLALSPVYMATHTDTASIASLFASDAFPAGIGVVMIDEPPDGGIENVQAAGRIGLSWGGASLYLLGYHGILNREIRTIETVFPPAAAPYIKLERVYPEINVIGISGVFELLGVIVNGEVISLFDAPVILDSGLAYANELDWSLGIEWEILSGLRLIVEYSDSGLIDKIDDVDESAKYGDSLFGAVDLLIPAKSFEFGITSAATYDWSGKELVFIEIARLDFLNGIVLEMSAFYPKVIEVTSSTTQLFELMDGNIVADLRFSYSF